MFMLDEVDKVYGVSMVYEVYFVNKRLRSEEQRKI